MRDYQLHLIARGLKASSICQITKVYEETVQTVGIGEASGVGLGGAR